MIFYTYDELFDATLNFFAYFMQFFTLFKVVVEGLSCLHIRVCTIGELSLFV